MKIIKWGSGKSKDKQKDPEKQEKNLNEEQQVSFNDLFSDTFMKEHTEFESFGKMLESSGFSVDTIEDFEKIPPQEWDAFVSKRTQFSNWEEMMRTAAETYFSKKLGS